MAPTLHRYGSYYQQWYSGSGMLVATDWRNEMDAGRVQEAFGMDAMGNMRWQRSGDGSVPMGEDPVERKSYEPATGRFWQQQRVNLGTANVGFHPAEVSRSYDADGNVDWAMSWRGGVLSNGMAGRVQETVGRSFYGADGRLRYFQETNVSLSNNIPSLRGVWEEYRYDPLGRRVLVDTRRQGLCDGDDWECTSATTRSIWAGDQLLWEVKGKSESPGEALGNWRAYGTVSYFHAGGIDRPLVITKDGQSIVPHQNWRGQFARGTYPGGQPSDCGPGQTSGCTAIAWPGIGRRRGTSRPMSPRSATGSAAW